MLCSAVERLFNGFMMWRIIYISVTPPVSMITVPSALHARQHVVAVHW